MNLGCWVSKGNLHGDVLKNSYYCKQTEGKQFEPNMKPASQKYMCIPLL